jgi:predicted Zn-dependent protease
LREETRISPDSALPLIRMASIALQRHRPEEGRPSAERSLQLAPDSAEAHYVMGRTLLELGKTAEAIEELRTASRLAPNSPEVHFNLARAYAKAKLPDLAEQERATFTRLNALVERRKSMSGSQAYGGSHDRVGLAPPAAATQPTASPE